ncbi:hypothetical protein J7L60_06820 [Candidatus Bathyarchaeota archaeon]|nr:hypothetical protein [Candidatus Bathyarchaeota archaeon]
MAKKVEEPPEFNVVITGKIKGFNIATGEEAAAIRKEMARQQEEIDAIKKALKEQQSLINLLNSKLERIENFLRSFK